MASGACFYPSPGSGVFSFIIPSGSKLLEQSASFLLNSTRFELCFTFLRYVLFLFIFDIPLHEGTEVKLVSMFISSLHLYYMLFLVIIYF